MIERNFELENISPIDFFGSNNEYIKAFVKGFPKLKIVIRDQIIKVNGSEDDISVFTDKLDILLSFYEKTSKNSISQVNKVLETNNEMLNSKLSLFNQQALVIGKNGKLIKAKSVNQQKMVDSIDTNDLVFAIGPAGTGKTYTAVALAVRALKNKEVRRIVLTRPAVEAGENLGFLPGDLKDKLDPYLQPLYDALHDMIPKQKLEKLIEDRTIEIAPLAFMRGRTLENAFVILDEAQNTTSNQMKMFLTRMGNNSKFIVTGDCTQVDLPRNQRSGLIHSTNLLTGIKGINVVILDESDIVRHSLVSKIVKAYSKGEDEEKLNNVNKK